MYRQVRKGRGVVSKVKSNVDGLQKDEEQFLKLNDADFCYEKQRCTILKAESSMQCYPTDITFFKELSSFVQFSPCSKLPLYVS